MSAPEETTTDSDRIGYRRVLLLLLVGCYHSIVSINHTLPTFQGYTPRFFCQVDNISATLEGCVKHLNTSVVQSEPSCPRGYQFESERDDWTVVTEWQLVCERRFLRPLIATIYFCGVTVGAIVCGLLADKYGRRPVVLICLYVQGLLGISLYFTNSLEVFMVLRFIQGFFLQGLQGTTFALLIELFPPKFRTLVAVIVEMFWSLGLMYLAGASYLVPQWRPLELVLSVPTAATLLYVCLVPESPRWLGSHGKPEEAQRLWNKILSGEVNTTQTVDSVQENSFSDEIWNNENSVEPGYHHRTKKEDRPTNEPTVARNDSSKSLIQIVINNILSDRTADNEDQTMDNRSEKDSMGLTKLEGESGHLNNALHCHCKENVRNDIEERRHSFENNPKKKNKNINTGNDCDTACHTEKAGFPSVIISDVDASVDSGLCLDNLEVRENMSYDTQSFKQSEIDNSINEICRTSSVSEGLNRLWREIVQELGYDMDDKAEIEKDEKSLLEETLCDNNRSANTFGLDSSSMGNKVSMYQEDEAEGNVERNNKVIKNKLSDKNLRKKNDIDMDHVDVIYNYGTNRRTSLKGKSDATTNIFQKEIQKINITVLFRNSVLRKFSLIMVFVWFTVALSYYGIMFHLPGLSGERHLNFFLGALLEMLSFVVSYVVLSRFGRRLPMAAYTLISGITCLGVAAVSVVPEEDVSWIGKIQTTLALIGKSSAISGFCTMFLYASELFPTVLRGAAMGHCGLWARIGSLIAPQLLFLGEYTLPALPLIIIGVLGVLAGISVFALPETLGQQLPDTVEEAEMLDRQKEKTETGLEGSGNIQMFWFEDQLSEI
ncbi:solute carrier family 22 member 3-like [Periplaneta americana]|uniref:solute carrier family 22 member 3-like n=1 Tax=Periplaneta americana TaxID=6978 RepID=UPI0037E8EFB2